MAQCTVYRTSLSSRTPTRWIDKDDLLRRADVVAIERVFSPRGVLPAPLNWRFPSTRRAGPSWGSASPQRERLPATAPIPAMPGRFFPPGRCGRNPGAARALAT
jgi:hypothetical protein